MSAGHPAGADDHDWIYPCVGVVGLRGSRSDLDDGHHAFEPCQVSGISAVDGDSVCGGCRGDQQVGDARAAVPAGGAQCSEDPGLGTGRVGIERQRVPCGGDPLKAILAPRAFVLVTGGVWSGRKFGKGDRGDRCLVWQLL